MEAEFRTPRVMANKIVGAKKSHILTFDPALNGWLLAPTRTLDGNLVAAIRFCYAACGSTLLLSPPVSSALSSRNESV